MLRKKIKRSGIEGGISYSLITTGFSDGRKDTYLIGYSDEGVGFSLDFFQRITSEENEETITRIIDSVVFDPYCVD